MNPLTIGLGLGIVNGGVNYLADNMWDKQMKPLVRDQQEISRFSGDLNAAKIGALNTALSLGDNSTVSLLLSSIGNKAGPTKYKSDFASSLISGISDSLNQANHYGLFKLKKKDQSPTTVEITPPKANTSLTTPELNIWTNVKSPFKNPFDDDFLNAIESIKNKVYSGKQPSIGVSADSSYNKKNYSFTQTEQKLNNQYPAFSTRDYILDSHQNKFV